MTNENEYEIKTIADFEKVPDDRLCDCLKEFASCLIGFRASRNEDIRLGLDSFVWIDDGIEMIKSINLTIGDTTENIANPNFPRDTRGHA